MRSLICLFTLVLILAAALAQGAELQIDPPVLAPGQPALVRLCLKKAAQPALIVFEERKFPLLAVNGGCLVGPMAVDLRVPAGIYVMRALVGGKQAAAARLKVQAKDYGERRIAVDPKFMRLTPAQLKRHKKEMARQRVVYDSLTPRIFWQNGFEAPVPGVVVGPFGRRSVINGEARGLHGGVDFRAAQGAPIKAAAAGKVALVDDTFFGGLTVLIDHGQGLITAYRHLSAASVKPGQAVEKGQVVAKAGATGRVTGPHLHFDVHLAGARVDPLAWIDISRRFPRIMQGGN